MNSFYLLYVDHILYENHKAIKMCYMNDFVRSSGLSVMENLLYCLTPKNY